jgi:excisionase family DNA binding protein
VTDEPKGRRFLTIEQTAEELNVSDSQIRALLRTGDLRGIQVGGRGRRCAGLALVAATVFCEVRKGRWGRLGSVWGVMFCG